jgi:hypothetical protein
MKAFDFECENCGYEFSTRKCTGADSTITADGENVAAVLSEDGPECEFTQHPRCPSCQLVHDDILFGDDSLLEQA